MSRSVAGSADFQVFQFGGRIGVGPAFGRHQALVVAGSLGVAGTDGNAQPDRGVTQDGPAAGIILSNQGQVRIRSRNSLFRFLPLFVFYFFFLFRLIGYVAHVHAGRGFRDSLGLVGRNADHGAADAMGFGMGHISSFLADDRPGQYGIPLQFIAVCHVHGGVRIGLGVTLHDGYAQKGHAGTAGFRLHYGRVHRFQPDGVRR